MSLLFTAARVFPFWAIPLVFILVEVGVMLRRRRRKAFIVAWLAAAVFLTFVTLWIINRGDLYSDQWLKKIF